MNLRHAPVTKVALLALSVCFFAVVPAAPQSLSDLQAHFDREENPVHKAKMIEKLGDAQFIALHAAEKADDYNAVGVTLEKYRDNVRAALAALKKERPDAERKSGGYRQLQMQLHRGIREVEEALLSATDEFKPPLQLVHQDLIAMNEEMLRLLFPRRTDAKANAKPDSKPDAKPDPKTTAPPNAKPDVPPAPRPDPTFVLTSAQP